ncbi:MAG: GNAT family N-acetyltransferase [Actinobacteria bacterium]|nr:GNAT family N-acetyltransferase [Actinomycetota bacterium]
MRRVSPRDETEFLGRVAASRSLHADWVAPPANHEEFATWLRGARRRDVESLLVCRNDDRRVAGVLTLSQIFMRPFGNAYLGFYAFVPHAGRGLMTEGLDLTLRHAFGSMNLHRVEANVQPGNAASISLLRRLGFRLEGFSPRYLEVAGRWRDHERWAITVEERPET